jgi:hypothetical protein
MFLSLKKIDYREPNKKNKHDSEALSCCHTLHLQGLAPESAKMGGGVQRRPNFRFMFKQKALAQLYI